VPRGQTVTVTLNPSLNDFTQVSEDGKRFAQAGEYVFQFGIPETQQYGQGFAVHKVEVS